MEIDEYLQLIAAKTRQAKADNDKEEVIRLLALCGQVIAEAIVKLEAA